MLNVVLPLRHSSPVNYQEPIYDKIWKGAGWAKVEKRQCWDFIKSQVLSLLISSSMYIGLLHLKKQNQGHLGGSVD